MALTLQLQLSQDSVLPRIPQFRPSLSTGCCSVVRAPTSVSRGWRLVARAEAEAPPAPSAAPSSTFRPGEKKGFVEEMRIRAMKLHTRSQAKEGEQAEKEKPVGQWSPTKEGYLQFLSDSRHLYQTMEDLMNEASDPSYKEFINTGLERTQPLAQDLAWFESQGFTIPSPGKAGTDYADYLKDLAHNNPPAFICHFYNVYFAHSAGGRMIGRKVSESVLDGAELEFYKWQGDLQELLQGVREKLNKVAEGWTREQKDQCLDETMKSFQYSGTVLRSIFS